VRKRECICTYIHTYIHSCTKKYKHAEYTQTSSWGSCTLTLYKKYTHADRKRAPRTVYRKSTPHAHTNHPRHAHVLVQEECVKTIYRKRMPLVGQLPDLPDLPAAPANTSSRRARGTGQIRPRVIVIGAGVSGLATARRLRENNVEVVVFEARGRTGGRICTDTVTYGSCVCVCVCVCSWE
jgi:hypothetical protein